MSLTEIKTPGTRIKTSTRKKLRELASRENQVIVHCAYQSGPEGNLIRIWPTTFLIARDMHHRSELVHIENITYYPEWMPVPPGTTIQFTLIFTGLPKGCLLFDLVEEIPQEGGFYVSGIVRNETDVYSVIIN